MITAGASDFYGKLRQSPDLWSEIAAQPDMEAQITRTRTLAADAGYDLTDEEIRQAFTQYDVFLAQTVGSDELSDNELALVAAGTVIQCQPKNML